MPLHRAHIALLPALAALLFPAPALCDQLPRSISVHSLAAYWDSLELVQAPLAVSGAAAAYDTRRDRMIVLGGRTSSTYVGDVWSWSEAASTGWQRINTTGTPPSPRSSLGAVYDSVRDRVITFGGTGLSGLTNEVWTLDFSSGADWHKVETIGDMPPPRIEMGMSFDTMGDRVIVFSGLGGTGNVDDMWQLSLMSPMTWSRVPDSPTRPSPRHSPALVSDTAANHMILFGGVGEDFLNDTWSLNLADLTWSQVSSEGALPAGRIWFAGAFDATDRAVIVYGGQNWDGALADSWRLRVDEVPTRWEQITGEPSPGLRWNHAGAFDPGRRQLMVFGGFVVGDVRTNDLWSLDASADEWVQRAAQVDPPPVPRSDFASTYDPVRNRMLVFGGSNGTCGINCYLSDDRGLSLDGVPQWAPVSTSDVNRPRARLAASAIYDPVRDRMVVFGGESIIGCGSHTCTVYNLDTYALTLSGTPAWQPVYPVGAPPGCELHSAIYDAPRDRMIIWGGVGNVITTDAWALGFSPVIQWSKLATVGTPPAARHSHAAIYDPIGDRMIVFGGETLNYPSMLMNDVWELSLGTLTWHRLEPSGDLPVPRSRCGVAYDTKRHAMVILSGLVSGNRLDDAWALRLDDTRWEMFSVAGATPGKRGQQGAVYDAVADRYVMFGGHDGIAHRNDAWALVPDEGTSARSDPPPRSGSEAFALTTLWPNPAHARITASFTRSWTDPLVMAVVDAAGRIVWRTIVPKGEGTPRQVQIDLSGELPAGVYSLRISDGTSFDGRRFVLLR